MRKTWLGSLKRYEFVAALGHDIREFALLWLVFALLDVFVAGKLTWPWIAGNLGFSAFVWFCGAYIEAGGKETQ